MKFVSLILTIFILFAICEPAFHSLLTQKNEMSCCKTGKCNCCDNEKKSNTTKDKSTKDCGINPFFNTCCSTVCFITVKSSITELFYKRNTSIFEYYFITTIKSLIPVFEPPEV